MLFPAFNEMLHRGYTSTLLAANLCVAHTLKVREHPKPRFMGLPERAHALMV
jgi:hypothetical protein